MKTLFIERNGPDCMGPVLEGLFTAAQTLGYKVDWWLRQHFLHECDVLIHWGWQWTEDVQRRTRLAKRCIYIEKGWFNDRDTCLQVDPQGTGARASWADDDLVCTERGPLMIRSDGALLICLRYEKEGVSVDNPCPYFQNNSQWLMHFTGLSIPFPVIVRPHFANNRVASDTRQWRGIATAQKWEWSRGTELIEQQPILSRCKAVAVVDSTVGAKALELGLPVLCYGNPVYRKPGVCYEMTDDTNRARRIIHQLGNCCCSLDRGAIKAMVAKMKSKEWHAEDIPQFPDRLRAMGL